MKPEDIRTEVTRYVEAVERTATEAEVSLLDALDQVRTAAGPAAVEQAMDDLEQDIRYRLEEVLTALPCAEGLASFLAEVNAEAWDPADEAEKLLHETRGRRLTDAPADVLDWMETVLGALASSESAEQAAEEAPSLLSLGRALVWA